MRVLVFASLVVLGSLMIDLAFAQIVEHEWIMNDDRYRTEAGAGCCGEEHCRPAKPGEILRIDGGWLHVPTGTTLMDDSKAIYPSRDPQGRLFICVIGSLKCLFPGGAA